jgi:hypothetical protein
MKTELTAEQIANGLELFKTSNEEKLQATKVGELLADEKTEKSKGLLKAIETGKILSNGIEWFEKTGKSALQVITGQKLSKEDIFLKIYGLKKASAYRYIQSSKIETEIVNNYIAENTDISILGLLAYVKPKNDVKVRPTQLRLSFGDKKVLFSPESTLSHCDFSESELLDTIQLLQNALKEIQALKA